jgi:hypothetical protein
MNIPDRYSIETYISWAGNTFHFAIEFISNYLKKFIESLMNIVIYKLPHTVY